MKQFALSSASFTGQITYTFNERGFLIYFSVEAELDDQQFIWILKKLPLTMDEMEELQKVNKFAVTEVAFKVSFDMFWDKYNDKVRSSRKKSLIKWGKMNQADQVKAYNFISKYNRSRGSAEMKYAETYLNAELWNN